MQASSTTDPVKEKESLYELVIQNKALNRSFFDDSSDEDSDCDALSDDSVSDQFNNFKFNEDHCLHVFNTIKQDDQGLNRFEM